MTLEYKYENSLPAIDDYTNIQTNTFRIINVDTSHIQNYHECVKVCQNTEQCETFKYEHDTNKCTLFRLEPYKTINNLSLLDCTSFCKVDDQCDYLSHSHKNTCKLHTREEQKGVTNISGKLLNYATYGYYDSNDSKNVKTYDECQKQNQNKDFVFYDNGTCIPKKLTIPVLGNTVIFFDKTPKKIDNTTLYIILLIILLIFIIVVFTMIKRFSN